MGKKKVKLLPFFSNPTNVEESAPPPLWPWPAYCQQPRTLSFRDTNETFKTIASFEEDDFIEASDPVEEVIKGSIRSERLFFEPEETSSILDEANSKQVVTNGANFKKSVAMSIESRDPYSDFKKSMEEMTEAHGLKDSWEELQELLCCYLRLNEKNNHGYILGAFVDLLVGFALASSSSSPSSSSKSTNHECICACSRDSPSSPLCFYTSSSSCSVSSSSYGCSTSLDPSASSSALEAEDTSDGGGPCLSLVEVEVAMEEEEEEES